MPATATSVVEFRMPIRLLVELYMTLRTVRTNGCAYLNPSKSLKVQPTVKPPAHCLGYRAVRARSRGVHRFVLTIYSIDHSLFSTFDHYTNSSRPRSALLYKNDLASSPVDVLASGNAVVRVIIMDGTGGSSTKNRWSHYRAGLLMDAHISDLNDARAVCSMWREVCVYDAECSFTIQGTFDYNVDCTE
jgi:hypothetical protein